MSLRWVDRCESTQDALRQEPSSISALATLNQTKGRGRRGRAWISPPESSLALSWRAPVAQLNIEDLPLVSLAAGVGLFRWVEAQTQESLKLDRLHLKWPNDLLFEKRKLAGILCEAAILASGRQEVIVGVGLNLTQHKLLPSQSASLDELCGPYHLHKKRLRKEVVPQLVSSLGRSVLCLVNHRRALLDEWRERSLPLGTELTTAGRVGRYRGITDGGALRLDIAGRVLTVESGEVALVGELT